MRIGILAAAAALAFSAASAAHADLLNGNDVTAYLHSLDTLGNTINGTPETVTAPATTLVDGSFLSATYADKQITVLEYVESSSVSFFTSNFNTGTPFVTNGLEFFSLLNFPGFTSVTVNSHSTVSGATVTFTDNYIDLNLAGLTLSTGDKIILDLNGGPSGAPEPGAWALMITGLGLTGAALRQRRRQPAAVRA